MVVVGDQPVADVRTSSTFASLAVVTYRRLFAAGLIAFLAVQSQVIARGWLANELTGTNTGLGGVYMAFGVPMLIATPFGGVLADRLSKRLVIAVCLLVLAATAAWIGFGVAFDFVEYWMLLVASAAPGPGVRLPRPGAHGDDRPARRERAAPERHRARADEPEHDAGSRAGDRRDRHRDQLDRNGGRVLPRRSADSRRLRGHVAPSTGRSRGGTGEIAGN